MKVIRGAFASTVLLGWAAVAASGRIKTVSDATTTEAFVTHFVAWILVISVVSIAPFVREWRYRGGSWQKTVFWAGPTLVVFDVMLHWVIFGVFGKKYGELPSGERALITLTYFAAAPLFLAIGVALLTQIRHRLDQN